MTMRLEQSITINRPITDVFAFVSNPANNPLWQPEVIEHTMLPEGPMATGSKMHHVSKFMGRRIEVNGEVTEFVPNRKIAFNVTSGTLLYTIYYFLDAQGQGTRFTYASVMPSNGFLKLAQPLIRLSARRVIDGDLARLKLIMEKQS